jgi:ankyrin repeat protein
MGGEAVEVTPHGVVCKLRVRLNANAKALTLAELRGRRRAMHLAAFAHANADTARALERIAGEGRLTDRLRRDRSFPRDFQGWLRKGGKEADLKGHLVSGGVVTFTAAGYLGYLRRGLHEARKRHAAGPAEQFAADGAHRAMTEEMLAVGAAAESCLRWYLEDPGVMMETMMRLGLMAGHRSYLGFLERTLPAAGEAGRDEAAGRLCRALGAMEASVDEVDEEGFTPLHRAAADGAGARMLRCLVTAGADLEARDKGAFRATAVWWAAYQGHAEAVAELGRLGADVNAVGEPGAFDDTPVFIAASYGHVGVIEALGRLGADVNCAVLDGRTPMCGAAAKGHLAAVEALARLGADVNRASLYGLTPVSAAAANGHAVLVEALARLGADLNTQDNDGTTPVYAAAKDGHSVAVEALARLGANVNRAAHNGTTPVFAAAANGHAAEVEALARLGADVNTADDNGWTPLQWARHKGHFVAVAVLVQLGAR